MSTHVDPIPREARPFQGHRAGLVTRTAAAAIDIGIVILALGVCYLGVSAVLFLIDPRNFTAPAPSLLMVYAAGGLLLTIYLAVSWTGSGRTYGNHVMGLRVVNHRGKRLHPRRLLRPCRPLCHFSDRAVLGAGQWPKPLAARSRRAYLGDLRLGCASAGARSGTA